MTRFLLGFGLFSMALCAQAHVADSVEVYRSSDLDEVLISAKEIKYNAADFHFFQK